MFARLFGGAVVCLALAGFGMGVAGEKAGKVVTKDVVKEKNSVKELPSVSGKIKSVDAAGAKFVLALDGGKQRTFHVDESTKFIGPKGGSRGMGKAGLKDDTMVKGNDVRVVPAANAKLALEVHLPIRKAADAPKEKKK